jgi:hypothetical protein
LISTGASQEVLEAASWIESIQIGETIDTYAKGIHSATWRIPPEQRKDVIERLNAWAVAEFGSREVRFDIPHRFVWERFHWNLEAN